MALDYGRRRIGVAASDPTGTIARPRGTVVRGRAGGIPSRLSELVTELRPLEILIGIPYNMDGSEGEMALEARKFAREVEQSFTIPVIEWDERLTTARAIRELESMQLKKKKRREKGRRDEVAAALMLADYLRRGQVPAPAIGTP